MILKMEKNRLKAVDGLRGLAALSVCLAHAGFNMAKVVDFRFADFFYKALAVGPNSVQIFFVLSGFLIAYLYPQITDVGQYLGKRYG